MLRFAQDFVRGIRWVALAAAIAWLTPAAPALADSFYAVQCGDVGYSTLLTVEGFPGGAVEHFTFVGQCALEERQKPGSGASAAEIREYTATLVDDGVHPVFPGTFLKDLTPKFMVNGDVRWTRATQGVVEVLTFSGAVTGSITTQFSGCFNNPYLLGGITCTGPSSSQGGFAVVFDAPASVLQLSHDRIAADLDGRRQSVFYRRFDIYTAEALAKANAPNCVPAPQSLPFCPPGIPPPVATGRGDDASGLNPPATLSVAPTPPVRPQASNPAPSARTVTNVAPTAPRTAPLQVATEAERLLAAGALSVRGGAVAVQPMQDFGPQWGGNAQVFWTGASQGSAMLVQFTVPEPGAYALQLSLTQAPDFADLGFAVDGVPAATGFSGFAPAVTRANVPVGTFSMQPGNHTVMLTITGKSPLSSGFLVGVDQLVLTALPSR